MAHCKIEVKRLLEQEGVETSKGLHGCAPPFPSIVSAAGYSAVVGSGLDATLN